MVMASRSFLPVKPEVVVHILTDCQEKEEQSQKKGIEGQERQTTDQVSGGVEIQDALYPIAINPEYIQSSEPHRAQAETWIESGAMQSRGHWQKT